jgi:predicted glutamine amidotransferase
MCQLTFSHLKSIKANSLYVYTQWIENTKTSNKDGFGLLCNGKDLYKSKNDVQSITNFGEYFTSRIKTADPIIAHVRLATWVNGKKTIESESSHPFEGDKLILAHNGVLEFKDIKMMDNHKDATVDSIIFLRELEKLYDGRNFPEALSKAMELFNGTFAFLIYSKLENCYYVARGKTKKLNISYTKSIAKSENVYPGLVLNTDRLDLERALKTYKVIGEIATGFKFEYTSPVEIQPETIFKVILDEGLLEKVGEIKETEKDKNFFTREPSTFGNWRTTNSQIPDIIINSSNSSLVKKLTSFLKKYGLTYYEFDCMINEMTGGCLLGEELTIIDLLIDTFEENMGSHFSDKKKEVWNELTKGFDNPMFVYNLFDELKFPYMMNSKKDLDSALRERKRTV